MSDFNDTVYEKLDTNDRASYLRRDSTEMAMSFKEWNAVVQLVGQVIVVAWLIVDFQGGALAGAGFAEVAMRLVWAIVAMIVLNIVLTIVATIGVSIVQREVLKDEKADERDDKIGAYSNRNGGVITSSVAALSLLAVALGVEPVFAVYALFAAPMLGGTTESVSRLYYYRTM